MACRHCGHVPANRPRSLCWTCYYTPGVREKYPIAESKFTRRGVLDVCGGTHLDTEPTCAMPGTAEKVAVLERRAQMHLALWHPLDAPVLTSSDRIGMALTG